MSDNVKATLNLNLLEHIKKYKAKKPKEETRLTQAQR